MNMNDYIGIPYKEKGRTAKGVDCWGFICLYYKDAHNIELPHYFYDNTDEAQAKAIQEFAGDWIKSDTGDVVLIRQCGHESHVGIVKGDFFWHCEKGIDITRVSLSDPKWVNRIVGRYEYRPLCTIVVNHSPFKTNQTVDKIPAGMSLQELVDAHIPKARHSQVNVTVQGNKVVRDLWRGCRIKPGALVNIIVVPSGGGNNLLRMILTVGVSLYSAGAGGAWVAHALGAGVNAAVGTAIAGIMGVLLVNALVPPPRVKLDDLSGTGQSDVYSISGIQNQFRPFSAIPLVLGRHRMVPPYIGKYTMIQGSDQYLCAIFCCGYGEVEISDLKIGDTAITAFDDVEYELRYGTPTDTPVTIYPDTATETPLNVELTFAGGYQTRTTEASTDEGSVDITFPRGLVRLTDDGGTAWRGILIDINYKLTGVGSVWSNPMGYCILTVDVPLGGAGATWEAPIVVTGGGGSGLTGYVKASNKGGAVYEVVITAYGNGYTSAPTITVAGSTATFTPNLTQGYVFRETSSDPVRKGFRFAFPTRDQYDIRIKRISADATSDKDIDETYWTAIRSFKNEAPVSANIRYKPALVALRIKATGQLNGTIENLSCLVGKKMDHWNGSAWITTGVVSSNPADIYRHLLQGVFNVKAVADARIDLAQLAIFSAFCTTHGFTFNAILDSQAPLVERLQTVAAAGRASFNMTNNQFSVVIEDVKTDITQMFGPKNVTSFKGSRTFIEMPHCVRVKFFNGDNDFLQEIMPVYIDGYNEDGSGGKIAATIFQEMNFFGVTDPDHIWKLARFHIAQALWRQKTYSIGVDFENLACTRGDLVKFRHDAMLVGISDGRVKAANASTITIDENCPMESGKTYEVTIRKADKTFDDQIPVVLSIGDNTSLTASSGSFSCAAGDLFHFGLTDASSILCLVQKIEHGDEFSAQLGLVPYNADIYTADSGTIPAYVSQASLPDNLVFPTPPTALTANEYLYAEQGILIQGVSLLWTHSSNANPDFYEVEILRPDSTAGYVPAGITSIPTLNIVNLPVGDYSFRVRAVNGIKKSEWLVLADETLNAMMETPDDVSNMRIAYRGGIPWITWDAVVDVRDIKYVIKVVKALTNTWEEGVAVGTTTALEWSPSVKGVYLIKAKVGNTTESTTEAKKYVAFSALSYTNIKEKVTENPAWAGTIAGSVFPCPPLVGGFGNEWDAAISGFDGSFDVEYDASLKPDADGWTLYGSDYGSVADNILTIAEGGRCYYGRSAGTLSTDKFITVEAKLKLESDALAMLIVQNDGGNKSSYITISATSIVIGNGLLSEEIAIDMASAYREVKIVINQSTRVFVDGELLIVVDEFLHYLTTPSYVYFGRGTAGAATGIQYWANVSFAVDTYTQDVTPDGWTSYGTISLASPAGGGHTDYLEITIGGAGDHGYKRNPVMAADDLLVLTIPFDAFVSQSYIKQYMSINNTASLYGVRIRFTGGVIYAESTDGLTAISNVTRGYTDENICSLILYGDKFWFTINRELVLSGTAEAFDAPLGDDMRWGCTASVIVAPAVIGNIIATYVQQDTELTNGLCLMPGDTGTYTIENSVDIGVAAESAVDSSLVSTTIPQFNLLESPDLLAEADLLTGTSVLTTGEFAKEEISLDSDDWTPLVPGGYYALDYNLRLNLLAPDDGRLYVKDWTWEVDMPDVQDKQTEVTSVSGDITVTFDKAFQVAPTNVQVTIFDSTLGDEYKVTAITTTGFKLSVYNSAARVARTVFCLTLGY